jgi:peptide/nickel transport system permease protein
MPDTQQAPPQIEPLEPKQASSALHEAYPSRPADVELPEQIATPWRLAVRRFRRHRPGMIGLAILVVLYLMAIFAGFVAPYDYADESRELLWSPPTGIHFSDASGFSWRPFVHPFKMDFDENFNIVRTVDTAQRSYVRFFTDGAPYKLLGFIPCRTHLFGVDPAPAPATAAAGANYFSRVYLLGADGSGRDVFSRICFGARISMTIGLLGAFIVLVIGLAVGGASGYYGGAVDDLLQRLCEMVMLLPGFYLLLMLRFMFPLNMDSTKVYFAVILIMSLVGWAEFARVIRGMVLSIRNSEFVQAARAMGLGQARIIARHVLPNTMGYVVVATTLRIPGFILGESALSVLGLGIMEPTPSWGNMLQKAMDILELDQHPWVLWPGVFIFVAIMAFNLVGDGLRDALDPRGLTK